MEQAAPEQHRGAGPPAPFQGHPSPTPTSPSPSGLDHEAMLLAIVSHEDDVPVGGPDEPGQLEGIVGAWRSWLDRGDLVGFDAAQLGGRVQHANAPQERRVHLPEAEVAVRVGVGGKVPAIRSKSHRSYGSFVAMDGLGREGKRRKVGDSKPSSMMELTRLQGDTWIWASRDLLW